GIVIPANMWGKVKTTIQMVASIVIMLLLSVRFDFGVESVASVSLIVASVLLWLMAAATAISGVVYVIQGTKVIDFSK
ncbi:MAG: CDP-diacylglycerol--glycerol-3-phosphate 3-phosphatidyltransferase, partial [Clostridia bacterium]|nr:CDP-diacylglycerol--glycerol-3-phosphate 3-phosphatidyltransferase [Clostridia bacterium]